MLFRSTILEEVVDAYSLLQYGVFLTNHDQNRIIGELGQDLSKSKLAAGILLTMEVAIADEPEEDKNSGVGGGMSAGMPGMGGF